ncbi:MAG: recombinase family protein [Ruminococcaceae bacterium]|nr:recombinase family protein [Oscillospiraceae bacterium]
MIPLKIAAAYIRVSDERQDEYSPDSQLKKTREYAAKEGYLIPDEYVFYDDGISAKSAKRRTEFNRMIAMAKEKEHPFEVIYVWKFSRFARNQEESMVYKNLLRKKNVAVVSVSEPIPEGHFGTLIERIIEWMDEFYLINLGAEVTRGMTEKASRGEPTCAPPYGYVMKEKKYYPDESGPADIVREIFRRYAAGEAEREIAISLGERGIRTKSGKTPENRWIKYILNNPCYIGKIRWSLEGARAVSKRDYTNQNIMTVSGHHEPLISEELWETVQKRIEAQKKAYPPYAKRDQPVEYMLKGIVRCSACGATLAMSSATTKNGARSMQCCNYSRGSCHVSHSVTIPKLEEAFLQALEDSVKHQIFNVEPQKPDSNVKDTPDYEKLIAIEKRKLERAKAAYLSEIDSIEQYAKNKEDITARINELNALMQSEANGQILDLNAYTEKVRSILQYIKRADVTAKSKNEAVRTVVSKVVYLKSTKSVAVYFST